MEFSTKVLAQDGNDWISDSLKLWLSFNTSNMNSDDNAKVMWSIKIAENIATISRTRTDIVSLPRLESEGGIE